jgi:hypothetical protein
MSNKCPKCKSNNPETATFCADYGTQLPSLETPIRRLEIGSIFAGRYEAPKISRGELEKKSNIYF